MFSSEELHASHSQSPDSGVDWKTLEEISPLRFLESLNSFSPPGWFGKMSPEFCPTKEMRSDSLSQGWPNSGMTARGGCWTLNISECHSEGDASSLSDVLEDQATIPQKYYLSRKACAGILRRAEKRGKELPVALKTALESVVATGKDQASTQV